MSSPDGHAHASARRSVSILCLGATWGRCAEGRVPDCAAARGLIRVARWAGQCEDHTLVPTLGHGPSAKQDLIYRPGSRTGNGRREAVKGTAAFASARIAAGWRSDWRPLSLGRPRDHVRRDPAEAPVPLCVLPERVLECPFVEIRP